MNKNEILETLREEVEKDGVRVFTSKKEVEEFIKTVDLASEVISRKLEVDAKAKLGKYIVIEKRAVEEKSGEINGVAYTKPAHNAIKIKATKAIKELEV